MPFAWAAGIAAVGSLAGGLISSNASKDAAQTQADAANQANQLTQQRYEDTKAQLAPYTQLGSEAGGSVGSLLGLSGDPTAAGYGSLTHGFTADDFKKYQDPGYQFQLQQGTQALQNSQAAGDGVLSGGALKGLINYNQNMASTAYSNAYDRWNSTNTNTYNRLSGLLQVGQNSAAGVGAQGVNLAGTQANALMSGANATAAGQIGSSNAIVGGLNSAAGYYALANMGTSTSNAGVSNGNGFYVNSAGGYTNIDPTLVGPPGP